MSGWQTTVAEAGLAGLRGWLTLSRAPLWLRQALEWASPPPEQRPHFRDITSATDSRTSIAAMLPRRTATAHIPAIGLTLWPEARLEVTRDAFWRSQRMALEHEGFGTAQALNEHLLRLGLEPVRGRGEQIQLF